MNWRCWFRHQWWRTGDNDRMCTRCKRVDRLVYVARMASDGDVRQEWMKWRRVE